MARGKDRKKDKDASAPREVRYRGQVVRPASSGSSRSSASADSARLEAEEAIEQIKKLFHEGLITRAEAEKKRKEIMERYKRAKR